jgi:hypothetical protein
VKGCRIVRDFIDNERKTFCLRIMILLIVAATMIGGPRSIFPEILLGRSWEDLFLMPPLAALVDLV